MSPIYGCLKDLMVSYNITGGLLGPGTKFLTIGSSVGTGARLRTSYINFVFYYDFQDNQQKLHVWMQATTEAQFDLTWAVKWLTRHLQLKITQIGLKYPSFFTVLTCEHELQVACLVTEGIEDNCFGCSMIVPIGGRLYAGLESPAKESLSPY